jgi:hypothetical protein
VNIDLTLNDFILCNINLISSSSGTKMDTFVEDVRRNEINRVFFIGDILFNCRKSVRSLKSISDEKK